MEGNRRVKRNAKNNRNNRRVLRSFVILVIVIAIIGILDLIETSKLNSFVAENIGKNARITYRTWKKSINITDNIASQLQKSNTELVISNDISSVSVDSNKTGRIWLPYRIYRIKKLDGVYTKASCIKNPSIDMIKGAKYYGKSSDSNTIFDIYVLSGDTLEKHKGIDIKEGVELTQREVFLSYIPVEDFNIEDVEVYRGELVVPTISLYPQNATNIGLDYIEYNGDVVEIVEDGLLAKEVADTDMKVKLNGIEKNIHVSIKASVEEIQLNKTQVTIALNNWAVVIPKVMPEDAANKQLSWTSTDETVAIVEDGMIKSKGIGSCEIYVSTQEGPKITNKVQVTVTENPKYKQNAYGYPETIIEGPYYKDGILIVNKKYSIPSDFANGEDKEAMDALKKLQGAARNEGISLPKISGFRSYYLQKSLYDSNVQIDGENIASSYSARPGHSEHSTGLAFDIGSVSDSYGVTDSGKWLANNAHKFGFIIRYPQGKSDITGYKYEPWHIRYLGMDNATKVYDSGKTLEEFLELD